MSHDVKKARMQDLDWKLKYIRKFRESDKNKSLMIIEGAIKRPSEILTFDDLLYCDGSVEEAILNYWDVKCIVAYAKTLLGKVFILKKYASYSSYKVSNSKTERISNMEALELIEDLQNRIIIEVNDEHLNKLKAIDMLKELKKNG